MRFRPITNSFLQKSNNDNSYSADLEVNTIGNENINVQISFTGYTFNKDLTNTSSSFQVDHLSALKVAEKELKQDLENLLNDKIIENNLQINQNSFGILAKLNEFW